MKSMMVAAAIGAGLTLCAGLVFGQANGPTQFPLAAPAGKDSGALEHAPPGAVNQGAYDMSKWKYGSAWNAPAGAKIWNPVKLKMMQGSMVTGGTVFAANDPELYCAM